MKAWALWYVQAHGLAVFPLPPNRKAPLDHGTGIRSASRDVGQINAWWDAEPNANIGVVGCLRIDIDPKNGGDVAWAALIAQHGDIKTMIVRTPSTGTHYYLKAPTHTGNSPGALPKGIDVRGAYSGYTVAPPSFTTYIENKQVEGRYEIVDTAAPIADCPQWLLEILTANDRLEAERDSTPLRADITQEQLDDLRSALMSPEFVNDWGRWSDTGYALLGLGETGRELFTEYSQRQREAFPDKPVFEDENVWWRNHRNSTPRSDYRSVFARAQSMGWANPKSTDMSKLGFGKAPLPTGVVPAPSPSIRKFEVRNGWEFANAPGIRWRVDKLLPQQGVAVIYGPPAVGKSFMIIDLLMAIVRGIPYAFDQYKTEQCPATFVLAEGAAGVRQRLRAYQQFNELAPDSPSMCVISEAPNLFDAADSQALIDAIVPTGSKVTVVDTLHASMAGGDENSAKDMGVVLAHCRKLAAATEGLVILVHHVGKDADRGERGSSSIRGAMETMIELSLEPNGVRVARISKQKDGDSNFSWQFKLMPRMAAGPNGMEDSAIVTYVPTDTPVEEKAIEKPATTTDDAIFALVCAQEGVQTAEGMEFNIVVANVMNLRPDLSSAKIARAITKAIDAKELTYGDPGAIRLVELPKKE